METLGKTRKDCYNQHRTTGTKTATLGQLNPLRYRSYVYDQETGLYYLQSRYYNPEMGRFINADAFAATGQGILGNNMFAYCGNCPIINVDVTGMLFERTSGGGYRKETCNYKYIYSQSDNSVARKKLGLESIEHSGCGVVATYNALITLGEPKSFDEVLSYYNERPLMRPLFGTIGMSPYAVGLYFEDNGYDVVLTSDSDTVDILSSTADASIMYYLYDQTYTPLGLEVEAFGHHFVEYHSTSKATYMAINVGTVSNYKSFHYPSDYATNFVAILIYK